MMVCMNEFDRGRPRMLWLAYTLLAFENCVLFV